MTKVIQALQQALRSMSAALRTLFRGSWHLFVWEDVRAGTIRLDGMPRSFRVLMHLGMSLTVILLIGLIFSHGWRAISPLQPLTFYNDLLAGVYIPEILVPVVIGLLAIAWAFLLTGALHAPWFAKLFVLFLFALFDYGLMLTVFSFFFGEIELLLSGFTVAQIGLWNTLAVLLTGGVWVFLLGFFLFRWRRPERPGLEFPLILLGTTLLFFAAHFGVQLGNSVTQTQEMVSGLQLTSALEQVDTLLTPFLVISGVEIVLLAMALTRQVSQSLHRTALQTGRGKWLWVSGLGLFLLFRLWQEWIRPWWTNEELNFSWGIVLITVLFLPFVWFSQRSQWFGSRSQAQKLPVWVIPGAAVLLFAIIFVLEIGYLLLSTAAVAFIAFGASTAGNAFVDFISGVFGQLVDWNAALVSAVAFLIGLVVWLRARLRRQPFPSAVLYAFLFGVWTVWWTITRTGRILGVLTFRYEHIPAMAVLFLCLVFLGALLLRRLTPRTLLWLSAAAVLFWLLGLRDLLDDPFSPLFVLLGAQAALISVSIFLNVMNAGNRFGLNKENSRWPRLTRGLLYFGYALLTVINMLWLVAGHQSDALATNEILVNSGFGIIGVPLVVWALMVGSEEVLGKGNQKSEEPV